MYVLGVDSAHLGSGAGYERLTISDGHPTRYGRIELAGEVIDAEPILARRLRVIDGIVISVVVLGEGEYRSPGDAPRPISGPTLILVVPGQPHWYGTSPGQRWTERFAVVHGPIFETVITATQSRSGPQPLPAGARPDDLADILRERSHAPAAEDQVWALAHWLAGALRESVDDTTRRWNVARQLLTDDFRQPPVLADIADEIGLSYEAFRRQFRERYGRAPLAYRNERRLQSAATMLRLTTLSCQDIAERLGYSDEFHLSRRFKARFGLSPTPYRRSERR